jgi:NAD(P)-dependent dehydrogenase (short-subunit alcohol dehydrogenase family)
LTLLIEADWNSVAARFPVLDMLVNNAGITGFAGPFAGAPPTHEPENVSLADWRAVNTVDNDGTFLGCRYAISAMRAKGAGSIINISSRSGLFGISMAAVYDASKAAIRNHTK